MKVKDEEGSTGNGQIEKLRDEEGSVNSNVEEIRGS